jgi:hypothetical protein
MSESLYSQKMVDAIETLYGKYNKRPEMKIVPNLYKKYGCWGQTTYLRDIHEPVLIEIDQDVFQNNPKEGLTTVVHEMLEWRGIERGEQFPHQFAEQSQDSILSVAALTPMDYILQQRPLLSLILRGY